MSSQSCEKARARIPTWPPGLRLSPSRRSSPRGIERLRSRDPRAAITLEDWLTQVITGHRSRILAVDHLVAEEWGRLTASRPFSTVDSLLAATAKVHRLTLVTRNVSDIAATGVAYLNPFESSP